MSSLDNAITCHNRSWGDFCHICEEEAYRDYIQEMHDDYELELGDEDDDD